MKPENIAKIDEMWRKLPELREEGERAIESAQLSKKDMGAVNWAGLGVCEVGIIIRDDGQIELYMQIEEASPEASGLYLYVMEHLKMHGFPDVDVRTEW